MSVTKILLADDHSVVLEGLRRILDRPEFEIVGAVNNGHALVEAAEKLRPDLIVADLSMPSLNGVEAVRQIKKLDPAAKVVVLTMHAEPIYAVEAMRAGASGYVVKHAAGEELRTALQEVIEGRTYLPPALREPVREGLRQLKNEPEGHIDGLTARQREVLQLLAEGKQAKEIAAVLHVSPRTVEFHKYRIMQVLGLHSVAELAGYAVRHGILS